MPCTVVHARQPHERIDRCRRTARNRGRIPGKLIDDGEMLFELRPAREPVTASRHQLCIGQREIGQHIPGARMELANLRQHRGITTTNAVAQALGVFSEMFEGRIVGQRTDWHSDLLARARRAGGLWSASTGEEVACLDSCRTVGWAWPFPRTGGVPCSAASTVADSSGTKCRKTEPFASG